VHSFHDAGHVFVSILYFDMPLNDLALISAAANALM